MEDVVIAFGSCNRQGEEQPMWEKIDAQKPDIWIWLGDIIYADTEDMSEMASDYALQSNNKAYQSFTRSKEILGIWDDHDYGANNSGKTYAQRDSSKMLLLNFLGIPEEHAVRTRPGVYQSYTRTIGKHLIKVILLDVRYFRDEPGANSTIIGEEQWVWLEKELKESNADMHLIAGGSQFLPEDHRFEKWADYPRDRERLLNLFDTYDTTLPLLISGDRHIAEMSLVKTEGGLPILEVTSSGLTHSYTSFTQEHNRHRVVGEVVSSKNFGLIKITSQENLFYEAGIYGEDGKLQYAVQSTELHEILKNK